MKVIVQQFGSKAYSAFSSSNFDLKKIPHLYLLNIHDLSDSALEKLYGYLNSSERGRSQKFRFEKDKKEFVAARGALRLLISKYLSSESIPTFGKVGAIQPKEIQFEKGIFGKPKLAFDKILKGNHPGNAEQLKFNLSHSDGRIVIAFSFNESEIGIDIEKIKQPFEYQGIIKNYFTPKEQKYITSEDTFFELWTRKEALLKVTGVGLTNDLTKLDVSENGVISDFEDERFLPFSGKTYYVKSFKIEEYWVSLATENETEFEFFEMGKIID